MEKFSLFKWLVKRSYILGLCLTLIFLALTWYQWDVLKLFDLKIYDLFLRFAPKPLPPSDIVIVAIDDASLEKVGRWPWSRDKLAKMVENLSQYEPAVIAFDIILSEKSPEDSILAEALDEAGNVILPVVLYFEGKDPQPFPLAQKIALKIKGKVNYLPPSGQKLLVPIKILQEVAADFGAINMFPDFDGVLRWEALCVDYQGYILPSLTLKTAAWFLGIPQDKLVWEPGKGIYLGSKVFIPTDPYGRMLIPYLGPTGTFKTISAVDVLENRLSPDEILNKIILVGATAVGIYDLRVTPLSPVMPGVEKHANVIASILQHRFLTWLPLKYTLVLLLFTGIFSLIAFHYLKAFFSFLIFIFSALSISLGTYFLFSTKGLFLAPGAPLLTLFAVFISQTALKYAYSERQAKEIRNMFASYVTERVVNQLINNPSMIKLGGERKIVTVLFSDVRGFTSLSEKMPPEKVVELLNEYFKAMTEIIFKWEGTLDKFIGDAIMVFWGAPLPQEDHARRAVKCAVEMVNQLKILQKKWKAKGKPLLDIGIGINTGEVLVGNIGVEGKKMDYTVIGDHVNLASRLEGLNKKFGTKIIISEFTLKEIESELLRGELEGMRIKGLVEVAVKGKEKPVKIYEVEPAEGKATLLEPEGGWKFLKMETK
jgi:adenylate cyclase